MKQLFDLTDKVAVINGGTSTLGSSMAEALADYGAHVALLGRNQEKAAEIVSKLENKGVQSKFFHGDVNEESSIQQAADDIIAWGGRCDILINAPGVNSTTPFMDLTTEEWDNIMSVNLKGVVFSCQTFAKKMMDQGHPGSIINISSVSSEPPLSKVFTYSASKAGMNNVTQYLSRELAPYHIRVNAIIPGFFPAEQNRKILSDDRISSIMNHTPMERFGNPEELQGAAVWLSAEQASSFVTGALIRVDGGFGAMTI